MTSAYRQLLHPEVANLADVQRGFSATVDGADAPELLEQFAGAPEFADHRPVEAQLVNLAGLVEIVRRVRVRHEHHLVGPWRDADRLGVADVGDLALVGAVVAEHLDASVARVGCVDVAARVHDDAVDVGELTWRAALLSPRLDEHAVFRE